MGKSVLKIGITVVIMYVTTVLLLLCLSALVYYNNLDVDVAEGGIVLIYFFVGCIGGRCIRILTSKNNGKKRWSFFVTGMYYIIFLMMSFLTNEGQKVSLFSVVLAFILLLLGNLWGYGRKTRT